MSSTKFSGVDAAEGGVRKAFLILRAGKWDIPQYYGNGAMVEMDGCLIWASTLNCSGADHSALIACVAIPKRDVEPLT
jgi:hypothetical protein